MKIGLLALSMLFLAPAWGICAPFPSGDNGRPGGMGMMPPPGGMAGGMPGGMPGFGGPEGPDRLFEDLDLTQAQLDKLKTLRRKRRAHTQELMNSLMDAMEDLKDLLDKPDRSAAFTDELRTKHAEVASLETKLSDDRFESILEIRGILDAKQMKKFAELHKKMPKPPKNGGPPMNPDGGGPAPAEK